MKSLNIAYFGSSYFSANLLEHILIDKELPVNLKFVVTQPDQKAGRKQILTPTPVKEVALKFKNLKIKNSLEIRNLKLEISQTDLVLVYAYGDLIPKDLLDIPKYGFWNIHPSLLPKYRGPSPIATPLINGDKITGVTIIKMDEEIDHGPIIAQESLTIDEDDKRSDLEKKLTGLAFKMFRRLILKGEDTFFDEKNGIEPLTEQNHNDATYTKKLTKQDGFVSFENLKFKIENSPEVLYNLFRGLSPWPGIWTILPNGKRLKIINLTMKQSNNLTIKSVQLEGKNEVDFEIFNKAYKIFS